MATMAKPIEGFPNYGVTHRGEVFNLDTGRNMVLSPTMNGDLTVGLVRDRHQYRYSVKGLVARAFVPGEDEIFNTPILLDNDKTNLRIENIVWRPRWFAWQYTRQFAEPRSWHVFGPLMDVETLSEYDNYIDAATRHGLLCEDIRESIYNQKRTFPTQQLFAYW